MIDKKVIELYNEYKEKILNQINLSYGLTHRNNNNHVGIINLGATCHLNSLLQVLYHNKKFRQLIYLAYIDNKDSIILSELSLLFALLDKSITSTISAKDLTLAFGWNRSQTGSQQCSFELLNVFFEALQQTSTLLDDGIKKLFKGTICNVLKCPTCNYSSKKIEDYYYLTLNPPIKSNKKMRTLEEIIRDCFFNKEIVDWNCSECNENVQALKYEEILSLPETIIIHLNRLNFDYETMRRQKLTYPMSFPNQLLAKSFFNNDNDDFKLMLNDVFEFDSCIIHGGSANGYYNTYFYHYYYYYYYLLLFICRWSL
jgi:ubiquitin C-terminal hydrolase